MSKKHGKHKHKEKHPKHWFHSFHKKVMKTDFYPYATWFLMLILAFVAVKK